MCPTFTLSASSYASGMVARLDVSMFSPLATRTDGPMLVCLTCVQYGSAALSR